MVLPRHAGGLQAEARSATRELAAATIACSPLARSNHEMRGQESQEADADATALASPAAATAQPDAL